MVWVRIRLLCHLILYHISRAKTLFMNGSTFLGIAYVLKKQTKYFYTLIITIFWSPLKWEEQHYKIIFKRLFLLCLLKLCSQHSVCRHNKDTEKATRLRRICTWIEIDNTTTIKLTFERMVGRQKKCCGYSQFFIDTRMTVFVIENTQQKYFLYHVMLNTQ